jgi:hypothetical protein
MTKTRKWVLIGIAVVLSLFISCCGIGLLVPTPTKTTTSTVTVKSTVATTATLIPTVAKTATLVPTVKPKSIVATKQATMQVSTTVKPIATKALVNSANSANDASPCKIGQIKGNPNGANGDKIYHLPTWRLYKKLQNSDVVCFDTIQDAQNAGYRPSKVK